MQKLDYIKALEEIIERLKVKQLYFLLSANPSSGKKIYSSVLPILIQAKVEYENIKKEPTNPCAFVMSCIDGLDDIFTDGPFANFIGYISNATDASNMRNSYGKEFIKTYEFILNLYETNSVILLNDDISTDEDTDLQNGTIIFRVRGNNERISAETYSQIFKAIHELIETVGKLYGVTDAPTIVLLDSGSDTNLGVKTAIEVAHCVFTLFTEIFDYIINFRFAKDDRKMKRLQDSLTIRAQIMQAAKDGIITNEEEKEYIHLIKTRTDKLIGLNVTPHKAMNDAIAKSNSSGWLAFKQQYLLEQGNKQEE